MPPLSRAAARRRPLLAASAAFLAILCLRLSGSLVGVRWPSSQASLAWIQPPSRLGSTPKPRGQEGGLQRRRLLEAVTLPVLGGLLSSASFPSEPARAAGEAVASTGSSEADLLSNFLVPDWAGDFVAQALNSTGLGSEAEVATALGGNSGFLGLAVVAGVLLAILVPLLKFFIAGISTFFFLQVADERFNSNNKSRRQGQGIFEKVLRRLSGELEDDLDSRNLVVKRLNDELVGLQANIIEQAESQTSAQAHRDRRRAARFRGIWEATLSSLSLTDAERSKADEAVRNFRGEVKSIEDELDQVRQRWRQGLFGKDEFAKPVGSFVRRYEALNKQERLYKEEEKLMQELSEALPESKFEDLRSSLSKRDELVWLADAEGKPMGEVGTAAHAGNVAKKRVFVLKFEGDLGASRSQELSREISAILSAPGPQPEEVVLLLNSPGGSVTGYGLAAAELLRLRQRDPPVKLTVCVDELAASGGYLMACCADKILCSPFAAVGSIGVIAQIPNAAKRLEREGLDFIQTTAGKWKRTVTPFKVPTQADLDKQKEDIAAVYREFASFVQKNRPHVDIEQVATGEVWYGPDALARELVDELKTSGQYLLERVEQGAEVFSVRFKAPKARSGLLAAGASAGGAALEALLARKLGQQQSDGMAGGVQDLLQRLMPQGLGRSGPLIRAPEEQLAPQLLAEQYADVVERMEPAAREQVLEALLARELGL